jgi:hypothetical protein
MNKRAFVKTGGLAALGVLTPSITQAIDLNKWDWFNFGNHGTPIRSVKAKDLQVFRIIVRRWAASPNAKFEFCLLSNKGDKLVLSLDQVTQLWGL